MRASLFLAASSVAVAFATSTSAQSRCGTSYTIQPGDTLYHVGQQCRVSLSRIYSLNPNLDDVRNIAVGTTVRLSSNDSSAPDRDDAQESYTVESGDTAFSIAQALGLSLQELLAENEDLDPLSMAVGEVLDLPSADDRTAGFGVEPLAGAPGSDVEITARGLRPLDYVTLGVGRSSSEWRAVRSLRVNSEGRIDATAEVPQWARPGDLLTFVLDTDRGVTLKSDDFDVVRRNGSDDDERFVELEGRVRDGTECYTLTTPDGDLYSLVSDEVEFTAGEFVEVEGTLAQMSFCMQGIGTVDVAALQEVPAPGNLPDDTSDVDRAFIMGRWAEKGGNCNLPEFDVRDGSGGLVVETRLNGSPRTGDVLVNGENAFVFDQTGERLSLENRGEGTVAVIGGPGTTLAGVDVSGDGAVFLRC